MGRGDVAPLSHEVGTGWNWVIRLMSRLLYRGSQWMRDWVDSRACEGVLEYGASRRRKLVDNLKDLCTKYHLCAENKNVLWEKAWQCRRVILICQSRHRLCLFQLEYRFGNLHHIKCHGLLLIKIQNHSLSFSHVKIREPLNGLSSDLIQWEFC